MQQFRDADFQVFLRSLDAHLAVPFRVEIIGEAAAILAFHVKSGTGDIDVSSPIIQIAGMIEAAREDTGLQIPMEQVGIYQAPYEYETRLKRLVLPGVEKLQVFTPEKHDWALIKITRLLEKDIEDILEVADMVGFSASIFLRRFLSEMTHVIGRREDLVWQFLTMMEELFGSKAAMRMEKAIRSHKHWR